MSAGCLQNSGNCSIKLQLLLPPVATGEAKSTRTEIIRILTIMLHLTLSKSQLRELPQIQYLLRESSADRIQDSYFSQCSHEIISVWTTCVGLITKIIT